MRSAKHKKDFYNLPWLSIDQQIEELRRRGCFISKKDEEAAKRWLSSIGMSRIEGYLEIFRNNNNEITYCAETNLGSLMELYAWDKKLSMIVFEGCRIAEISVRVAMAHCIGKVNGLNGGEPFGHLINTSYSSQKGFIEAIRSIRKHEGRVRNSVDGTRKDIDPTIISLGRQFARCSKVSLCPACKATNHSGCDIPIPVWISIEHWTMETTKEVFFHLNKDIRDDVADHLNINDPKSVDKLIEAIYEIRNLSAHHARLYNRKMRNACFVDGEKRSDLFSFCSVLMEALDKIPTETIRSHKFWQWRLYDHMLLFPKLPGDMGKMANLKSTGMNEDWGGRTGWKTIYKKSWLFRLLRPILDRDINRIN